MNIIGPDSLIFGIENLDGAARYLTDYGLHKVDAGAGGAWTLERMGAELSRDRDVQQASDGVVRSIDADGYPVG